MKGFVDSAGGTSDISARCNFFLLSLMASLSWCALIGTPELRSSPFFAPIVTPLLGYTGSHTSASISSSSNTTFSMTGKDGEHHLIQRRPSYVSKTVFSDKVRFVFVASQDGTGHHGWSQAFRWNHICKGPMDNVFSDMSRFFFNSWSHQFQENKEKMIQNLREYAAEVEQQQQQQADPVVGSEREDEPVVICLNTLDKQMMSYPNGRGNNLDHHPDINLLAQIAEEAHVDLRIITLHRPPANVVVSCSVNRRFGTPYRESHLQVDQLAVLISQLESLDPAFYACAATSEVVETATHLQEHVFGGMSTERFTPMLVEALSETFVDRADNQTKALIQIHDKLRDMGDTAGAGSIDRVLDELQTSYLYFRNVVCANNRRRQE